MARTARHRHPPEGGYSCGAETRERIITAAVRAFGERGYDGTSTREIAAMAGVNAPALQYYFDGKEGVYLACAEHIVARVWEQMSEAVEHAERVVAEGAADEVLIGAYRAIQERVADLIFTAHNTDDWRLFMAREQAGLGPAAGFQVVYQSVNKRIYGVAASIVGRLLGLPATDDETLIRTLAISGQLMIFQVLRRTALTALSWDKIDAQRLLLLKRVVGEQTAALLRSMTAARGSRASSSLS